jgi:hypothetical protein
MVIDLSRRHGREKKRKKILSQRHKDTKKKRKEASEVFFSLCLCVFVREPLLFFSFISFPRSGVGMPYGRSSGASRDAGASGLAPTLERGSQMSGASPDATLECRNLLPRWSLGAR